MLRVELGHPRAALGRPPKLFGDGTRGEDWMDGDPDALWVRDSTESVRLCSRWRLPVPYEATRTRRKHIFHVGCQGERSMAGESFETVTPKSRNPASHQGVVLM